MQRIVVLGAGMVGATIAADLAQSTGKYHVTAVDADRGRVEALAQAHPVAPVVADLRSAAAVQEAIHGADLVVGAVPGWMGYATLQAVIEAGINVVDISFFPEDPFGLDELAKSRGVSAVVDCGVAPGLGNMLLGYHLERMVVHSYRCLVGGLPVRRTWPWAYKAPFSPVDVLEEYTRPARYVVGGQLVTRPALSEPELVEVAPVGTLEAFNTDGLRTLLRLPVPNMVEKTLRYPGHIEYVRVLRESGFLGTTPITVDGASVRPIDVTTALLFAQWKLQPGEPEFTAMEVAITGVQDGRTVEHVYSLFDETDRDTGTSSMARTTGYTCTAVARLVLERAFTRAGICPPEYVGAESECLERTLADLAMRGITIAHRAA